MNLATINPNDLRINHEPMAQVVPTGFGFVPVCIPCRLCYTDDIGTNGTWHWEKRFVPTQLVSA